MRRLAALTISCVIPLSGFAAANSSPEKDSLSDFPVVPVSSIVKANNDAKKEALSGADSSSQADARSNVQIAKAEARRASQKAKRESAGESSESRLDDGSLVVTPGVNEIIPVSVGHPNRIVMPFGNPKIRTTSSASFEVEGSSVYLSSNAEGKPITAFVTEKGSPEMALSLTFVPRRIPPIDLQLKVDTQAGGFIARPSKKAKAWEESQPYIQTIRDVLREVANGKTPQGYTLTENPSMNGFYGCSQPGLSFKFAGGQSVDGHRLKVNIGVVQNLSSEVIEFRETSCAGPDVKAVATWPQPMLQPGQRSEVYVVRGIAEPHKQDYNARRSLLQE